MDEIENAEIMEFITGQAEGVVRPTDSPRVLEVVSDGQDDNGAPMVAKVYTDAGTVTIYDRKTGEPSKTSVNMLPAQLRKFGPDGKTLMFSFKPVPVTTVREQHKCLLHEDDPDRATYRGWGLGTCTKANLPSIFMVEQHMQKCHKTAWATIKRERDAQEKRDERARREQHERDLVAALAGRATVAEPVVASVEEPNPVVTGVTMSRRPGRPSTAGGIA